MSARARACARVAVVADDLTGAADTAVQFLRPGEEILLLALRGKGAVPGAPACAGACAGLAIDTETRGLGQDEAVARVGTAAALVRRLGPALVYHKVDSQLRGRPGLEIETLRRELGLRCALVAPAHPGQDRLTVGGVHLVRGTPVAKTEAGRDPIAPVTESRLPLLVAQQSGVEVAHVAIAELEAGPGALERRLEALLAEGQRLITFDATTAWQLERIAEAAGRWPDLLLAGSAGLAAALVASRGIAAAPEAAAVPRGDSMLLVCGSASSSLRRQAVRLVESGRCRSATLTAASLAGEPNEEPLRGAAAEAWDRCDLVLRAPEERLEARTAPESILTALADVALRLVRRRRPDAVFLSGGDTARAVLEAAGVEAVRLRGEVMPGVPWGVAVDGRLDGVSVVTRSGAFGGEEDLLEIHRRCRKDGAT